RRVQLGRARKPLADLEQERELLGFHVEIPWSLRREAHAGPVLGRRGVYSRPRSAVRCRSLLRSGEGWRLWSVGGRQGFAGGVTEAEGAGADAPAADVAAGAEAGAASGAAGVGVATGAGADVACAGGAGFSGRSTSSCTVQNHCRPPGCEPGSKK